MRHLVGFICLLALGVVACGEAAGTGGPHSGGFIVVRDGLVQRYDATALGVHDVGAQRILVVLNERDPSPTTYDDQYADRLSVAFDRDALARIPIQQNHTISGEASWPRIEPSEWVRASDAAFVGNGAHLPAIQRVFFYRSCFACGATPGTQTIRGSLRLSVNTTNRLAGVLEVSIEGAVPAIFAAPTRHDLALVFDLELGEWIES